MNIYSLKRWQWAIIGLALGLIFSAWRGWVGPEGTLEDRTTLEASEFEKILLAKSPSGRPAVKNIRVYRIKDGTYWLSAQQLLRLGNKDSGSGEYVAVKIPCKTPFVPRQDPPAKVDASYTVVDYLKSVKAKHPELEFSTRWWDREPLRSPIFAVIGMVVLAGLCPSLVHVLVGAGPEREKKAKEREYDLSRFGKGKPESKEPTKAGPTVQELAHLRELDAELERRLAAMDDSALASVLPGSESPAGSAKPEQPIQKLTGGPLEVQVDDKPKPQKRYGGEFYPTETHVKREDKDPTA